MGRAELRRQARAERLENNKNTVRMTREQLDRLIFETSYQARIDTVESMMVFFALAEHDVHKFGKVRALRTMEYLNTLMDGINNDETTLADYRKRLEEEVGIRIHYRREGTT